MCFADKCYIFVYKNIWTIPIAIETIRETMAIIFEIRASFLAATVSAFAISSWIPVLSGIVGSFIGIAIAKMIGIM